MSEIQSGDPQIEEAAEAERRASLRRPLNADERALQRAFAKAQERSLALLAREEEEVW
ncbi:MAG: hypothetical protein HY901_14175 [Deltaproteobacteria bacterium]|nr:hypothetical protein [Deltaproteobacteria bacterium]